MCQHTLRFLNEKGEKSNHLEEINLVHSLCQEEITFNRFYMLVIRGHNKNCFFLLKGLLFIFFTLIRQVNARRFQNSNSLKLFLRLKSGRDGEKKRHPLTPFGTSDDELILFGIEIVRIVIEIQTIAVDRTV
jgi:hypothetical protein